MWGRRTPDSILGVSGFNFLACMGACIYGGGVIGAYFGMALPLSHMHGSLFWTVYSS